MNKEFQVAQSSMNKEFQVAQDVLCHVPASTLPRFSSLAQFPSLVQFLYSLISSLPWFAINLIYPSPFPYLTFSKISVNFFY